MPAPCGRALHSSPAGLEVARAMPAILTRLYALAAVLSLSARRSCELRVASCFLAAACSSAARRLASVLARSRPRPREGSGRTPRPPSGNGARRLACMQAASHGRDKRKGPSKKDGKGGRMEGRETKKTRTGSMSNKAHAVLI